MKRSGKPSITGFMSDQTPSPKNIHHWARFLSQDSPVLTGFEKIARKTDFAVLYFDVEIVKRGYYKTTIREIALRPNELPEFEITVGMVVDPQTLEIQTRGFSRYLI